MNQLPPLFQSNRSEFISISYERIKRCLEKGSRLFDTEEPDVLRLKLAADDIDLRCATLLYDFKKMPEVPKEWLQEIITYACEVQERLHGIIQAIDDADNPSARYIRSSFY